ncbi:MAG TPA: patatin-like phospholipase family protein [Thermoanaerobaculia bacterium]|nr:patatin-like phospholipase family protein [Thermoanaerobaculia bacterium]
MDATADLSDPARAGRPPRIGLALAGGAPEGAVYEVGALYALDEALGGGKLNDLAIYVGVSSGAVLAACLANGITPAQMCRILAGAEPGEPPFLADTFLQPAVREMRSGVRALPGLLGSALWDYVSHLGSSTLLESLTRLSQALPVGFFDNEPIRLYLEDVFTQPGRTDDFRLLRRPLVVVATDLDSGLAVRFGEPGLDHIPISRAVQASAALPGLYPPIEIAGRHYVDGILLKTVHASVALEKGAELVLCINPIVPVDTVRAIEEGVLPRGKLLDRGLPTVLAQTFRTLIHSRLEVGMAAYETRFRGADVVLVEPERHDYRMFFTNIFGFDERIRVCEHAYEATREILLARFDELAPVLARHGLTLRRDVLAEGTRDLWSQVGAPGARKRKKVRRATRRPLDPGQAVVHRLDDALTRLDRLVS